MHLSPSQQQFLLFGISIPEPAPVFVGPRRDPCLYYVHVSEIFSFLHLVMLTHEKVLELSWSGTSLGMSSSVIQ